MTSPLAVAVVNRVPYLKGRRNDVVERMVQAVSLQVEQDFSPAWCLQPIPVMLVEEGAPVPIGSAIVFLVDRLEHGRGAVARHTAESSGYFAGYVAVEVIQRLGGSMAIGHDSVSAALSHEVLELIANPALNLWAEAPDGRLVAREVCDPVSGDSYEIELSPDSSQAVHRVSVSNFVRPAWFHREAPSGSWFDQMQLTSAPFEVRSSGYVMERDPSSVAAKFGACVASDRRSLVAEEDRLVRPRIC